MRLILHYIRDMSWYVAIGFIIGFIRLAFQTIISRFSFGVASNTGKFYFNVNIGSIGHINLIPFRTIAQQFAGEIDVNAKDIASVAALNLAANLLLFSPLGFFLPAIGDKFTSFKRTILAGLSIVVLIETIQFFIGRSTDIDDVILNTVGIAVGYGIYKGVMFLFHRIHHRDK